MPELDKIELEKRIIGIIKKHVTYPHFKIFFVTIQS